MESEEIVQEETKDGYDGGYTKEEVDKILQEAGIKQIKEEKVDKTSEFEKYVESQEEKLEDVTFENDRFEVSVKEVEEFDR